MSHRVPTVILNALRAVGALAMLSMLAVPAAAQSPPADEVAAATRAWVDGFNAKELEPFLALYDPEAVFWGTSSPVLRDSPALVRDYFKGLPTARITVELGDYRVRVFGDVAVNSGTYTFTSLRDGEPVPNPARFSFTYRKRDGRWLIVDHHSSAVPGPR